MSEQLHTAINGFGRIGVVFARLAIESEDDSLVAIGGREIYADDIAERLMFDSVHRRFAGHDVEASGANIFVDGEMVTLADTTELKSGLWTNICDDLVVVDATSAYRTHDKARKHLKAGASLVVITSPVEDDQIPTIVRGVNDTDEMLATAAANRMVAVSSCSTNCIAPILKLFSMHVPMESASAQVIHARTNSQPHLDGRGNATSDRRSADNIVAASTGSATEVARLVPGIPFYSNSIRVPVPDGSLAIIGLEIEQVMTEVDVKELLGLANADTVIGTTEHDMFSAAVIGQPFSSVIDLNKIRVTQHHGRTSVELQAWFDNELGYTSRVLEVAQSVGLRAVSRARYGSRL